MIPTSIHPLDLRAASAPSADPAPGWAAQLEEVAAAEGQDWAAAFGFGLARIAAKDDPRPMMLVVVRNWMTERGRPHARGLARLGLSPERLMLVCVDKPVQALWALEETLKSGAVAGALATIDQAEFVATRRLDFAAKAGDACGVMLRGRPGADLSAARLRWQVSALPSGEDILDARAPGPIRWRAELTRRRDGLPGTFEWEEADGAPRLRLAPRLAGDGVVEAGRAHAAA